MTRFSIRTSPTRLRWVLWALLTAGFLLVSFHRVTSAVLADDLSRAFDTTGTELGLLHASFFYIYAGLQLPAGILVDRTGSRRVAAGGLGVMAVGVFGFALAPTYGIAFASRALLGLGGSVLYTATLRFLANWYRPDEFATMTGWTVAAAGMGGVLATTPLAIAIDSAGWRSVLLAIGVGGVGLAVVTYLAVRDRPRDAGFDPLDGVQPPESNVEFSTVVTNTRRVLGEFETWLMGTMLFLVIGTNFTVTGLWGVPYIADLYDVSVQTASLFVFVGNIGFLLGSPVIGTLSDRLGHRTEFILASCLVFTVSYSLIFLLVTPPLLVVGVLLFAALFVMGGAVIAFTVAKERHDATASATATGAINSMGYFGAAVFPAVMGFALDAYWTGETVAGARVYTPAGYRVAFGIATAAGSIAVLCAYLLHRRESRTEATPTKSAEVTD
ncbi:MFS transporter [Haloferax mediterranei ATCC 33500]|uniref:Lysosomal dipeptide transporter MFSD1 n=1 Tax=Haloferax mediterranei (strain ATCC 33500 / DSM 1411 / JCM 8866 / NBRC 14739 / NCIMB 2177 / R-4) TaxID=523841 RepID=I3R609_HALMT|nr:MFS transporter [Haloferax mediterranei]AFK19669.1 major facilitator family hexuronate transporter [Haloferax mediterranei ATCC 33500]AHZ23058.1 MFS transporter [Haloferax mediterranei ATCC 33500]ELZ99989.1 major facilitator family hexuronate transporter [Haloferax mediterranei ATCC 33500]MDX5987589.1 MFS transporter [Haloferax mediterranei ATCC 33500]QCQ74077.1 MFS transporter [Haloferax mediterranei ATCC 33500]